VLVCYGGKSCCEVVLLNKVRTLLVVASVALSVSGFAQYKDLHDFGGTITYTNGNSGPDGGYPQGGVTVDAAGNIYGTTTNGGANSGSNVHAGMVWEVTSSGTYLDLHDFGGTITNADGTSGPDGTNPRSGVTIDSSGNLYGVTYQGGPNSAGIVWKLTASGIYRDLHDFGGTVTNASGAKGADGQAPWGIALDGAGDLYGAATMGGPNSGGMIWEIKPSGTYLDLHDFGGTIMVAGGATGPDGNNPVANVSFDTLNDVFGTTSSGGANANGMVWELTSSGTYLDLHDFGGTIINASGTSGPDGANPLFAGVTLDGFGNFYGTASNGGPAGDGMVWELTASGTYLDLHDFDINNFIVPPFSNEPLRDGIRPQAGVGFEIGGTLYGTTTGGGQNYSDGGGTLWELGSSGAYGHLQDFGSNNAAAGPYAVTFDNAGHFYGVTGGGGSNGAGTVWSLSTGPLVESFVVSPASVVGGTSAVGTITLATPAPARGAYVNIIPRGEGVGGSGTIAFSAGSTSASFPVPTTAVSVQSNGVLIAETGGGWQSAPLSVIPASLASVTLNPTAVVGGANSTATVTLNGPAGFTGSTVTLSSNNPAASVPASVTVSGGKSSVTFTVGTSGVSASTSVIITATLSGLSKTAGLTIGPASLASIGVSPGTVAGGDSSTVTVGLNGVAGPAGMTVSLSSSNSTATVPAMMTIPSGHNSANVTAHTVVVSKQQVAKITATSGGVSKETSLTIALPSVASLALSPSAVAGGASSVGVVTLTGPAEKGGSVVKLHSNSKAASLPASLTVKAGELTATFKIKTDAVSSQEPATILASLNGSSQSATLTISPPTLVSISLSPSSVKGGKSSTATVTISSVAPAAGIMIALKSSASSASVPASFKIPGGKTSATFTVKTKAVKATSTATITSNLSGVNKTVTLTVTP